MNHLVPTPRHIQITERGKTRNVTMAPTMPVAEAELPEMYTAQALTAQNLITETTSGVDRAQATLLRSIPLTVILAILGIGLMLAFDINLVWTLLIFTTLTIGGYIAFTWLDYRHSASGLERHRIDAAAEIKRMELTHRQELKRMALETYLYLLEKTNANI